MKRLAAVSAFAGLLLLAGVAESAVVYNVAQGKTVTLNGTFFTDGFWGGDVPTDPQERAATLVDGRFLERGHAWDQGTVWWNSNSAGGANNAIVIDLGGLFTIESLVVQADDNPGYLLEYRDSAGAWRTAWDVPDYDTYDDHSWGMMTRPDPNDDTARYRLPSAILADALRFRAESPSYDWLFSVSEIQAYGTSAPVPEPSTMLLLGSGLAGLLRFGRKAARR